MGDYIFNIVIVLVFLYEAFILFTKKNGGSERMREKYTEESLAKFSIVSGVAMILLVIYEIIEILHKADILHFIPLDEDGKYPIWVAGPCLGGFIVIYLVLYFVLLKKKEGYTEASKGDNNKRDEEEDY